MARTTRRNLLRAAAAGSVAATGLGAVVGSQKRVAARGRDQGHALGHSHPISGNRAHVTVAFGQWDADPAAPFDRFPVNSDRTRNNHQLLPFEAEIEEGGAVSFIISGLHQIVIYAEGTALADIQTAAKDPANQTAGMPPLVNYPAGRFYRGLDPRVLTYATQVTIPPATTPTNLVVQDRVESVNFPTPGRYLVICSVIPHLLEGMHGYVNVRQRSGA